MRTALYGGSFDPIHHGHLILAREAMEQLSLDRVIFIPAGQSPFKMDRRPAPPAVRLAMVKAAIADEPGFECDDREVHLEGPSYSIETLEAWRARCPEDELFYFIGQDNVADFPRWRRAEDLTRLAQFVVFERSADAPAHQFPAVRRRMDISATEVRKRVAEGRSIRYLVPESVRALIAAHQLYRGNSH